MQEVGQRRTEMARQRTAVVDLDGTIATYDQWRGHSHFGDPIPFAKDALSELREWGWRIIVFTTRGDSESVESYLRRFGIPFDAVNSIAHNPPGTSSKPIADVYFDDRDAHVVGQRSYNWAKAMRRVRHQYQPTMTCEIDDAAAWSSWFAQFHFWLTRTLSWTKTC